MLLFCISEIQKKKENLDSIVKKKKTFQSDMSG